MIQLAGNSNLANSVTLADKATVAIAIATIVALFVNIYQTRKSNALTISQVNREGRIRSYAKALGGFRALLVDWQKYIQVVALENVPKDEEDLSSDKVQTSTFLNGLSNFEFRAEIDLLGSPEVIAEYNLRMNELTSYTTAFKSSLGVIQTEIDKKRVQNELNETKSQNALDKAQNELEKAQNELTKNVTLSDEDRLKTQSTLADDEAKIQVEREIAKKDLEKVKAQFDVDKLTAQRDLDKIKATMSENLKKLNDMDALRIIMRNELKIDI